MDAPWDKIAPYHISGLFRVKSSYFRENVARKMGKVTKIPHLNENKRRAAPAARYLYQPNNLKKKWKRKVERMKVIERMRMMKMVIPQERMEMNVTYALLACMHTRALLQ